MAAKKKKKQKKTVQKKQKAKSSKKKKSNTKKTKAKSKKKKPLKKKLSKKKTTKKKTAKKKTEKKKTLAQKKKTKKTKKPVKAKKPAQKKTKKVKAKSKPKKKTSTKTKKAPAKVTTKKQVAPKAPKKAPAPKIEKAPPTPTLKLVLCGPQSVYWLPKQAELHKLHVKENVHPQELEFSQSLNAPSRKAEFIRSRWLYHKVQKNHEPLIPYQSGYPSWPETTLGSLSHKDGHIVMSFASPTTHYALGLDLERVDKFDDKILNRICSEDEKLLIDKAIYLGKLSRQQVIAMMFSFKESVFKTHYPLGQKHFGFNAVKITDIVYERKELLAELTEETSNRTPKGHQVIGYYNFIKDDSAEYIITASEERKQIIFDNDLKKQIIEDEEADDTEENIA